MGVVVETIDMTLGEAHIRIVPGLIPALRILRRIPHPWSRLAVLNRVEADLTLKLYSS